MDELIVEKAKIVHSSERICIIDWGARGNAVEAIRMDFFFLHLSSASNILVENGTMSWKFNLVVGVCWDWFMTCDLSVFFANISCCCELYCSLYISNSLSLCVPSIYVLFFFLEKKIIYVLIFFQMDLKNHFSFSFNILLYKNHQHQHINGRLCIFIYLSIL